MRDTGPEDGAVCSERILSAAAGRMHPVEFSEMSLSAAATEDMPATYVVSVQVSVPRQSIRRLGW